MKGPASVLGGIALIPVGVLGALLLQPMTTGQENLARWYPFTVSNKTVLYFVIPLGVSITGFTLARQMNKPWQRWAVRGATVGLVLLLAWGMGQGMPLGIRG